MATIQGEMSEEHKIPPPHLGEFPVIETPYFARRYSSQGIIAMGVVYSPLAFVLPSPITSFFLFYILGIGGSTYVINEYRESAINKKLGQLTEPDTRKGWMYWAARIYNGAPIEKATKELEQYLQENTRKLSKGRQGHLVGRNMFSTLEVNLYKLEGGITCADILSVGLSGARRRGEGLLARLEKLI